MDIYGKTAPIISKTGLRRTHPCVYRSYQVTRHTTKTFTFEQIEIILCLYEDLSGDGRHGPWCQRLQLGEQKLPPTSLLLNYRASCRGNFKPMMESLFHGIKCYGWSVSVDRCRLPRYSTRLLQSRHRGSTRSHCAAFTRNTGILSGQPNDSKPSGANANAHSNPGQSHPQAASTHRNNEKPNEKK